MVDKKHSYQPISFRSNPPLREKPIVVPEEVNGIIRNKVVFVPDSNRSPFEGVVYSPETMSLRAKLNLGVKFTQVSFGQIENDPSVLYNRALHLEQDIYSHLDQLSSVPSPSESSVQQSAEFNVES